MKSQKQFASIEQVKEALHKLTPDDFKNLRKYAKRHLNLAHFYVEEDDFIHEAIYRALEERRRWNLNKTFVLFLILTIKSIVNEEFENRFHQKLIPDGTLDFLEDGENGLYKYRVPSAEDLYIRAEQKMSIHNAINRLRTHFQTDKDALVVIEGWAQDEDRAEVIYETEKISRRDYDSARKRLIRKAQTLPKY